MTTTTVIRRDEVHLLRWPAESLRRERYQALGWLRLLVVEGGAAAPICSDTREDWVRAPISDDDLRVRIAALRVKAEMHRLPQLDPHGMLRFGGRSATVSRTETDLLECLVRRFGALVPRSTLCECLPERRGSVSRNALDLHIMRMRRRIEPLGLAIRTVWGRGYVLEPVDTESAAGRPLAPPTALRGGSLGVTPGLAAGRSRPRASEVAAVRWSRVRPPFAG